MNPEFPLHSTEPRPDPSGISAAHEPEGEMEPAELEGAVRVPRGVTGE